MMAMLETAWVAAGIFLLASPGEEAPPAVVELSVKVPGGTPAADRVYIAGNLPALGAWSPTGLALEKRADGRFHAQVKLPRGAKVEFKVTRGSWATVEKSREGGEVPNRRFEVEEGRVVEIEVAAWASGSPPPRRSTITGDVRKHEGFRSHLLEDERTLMVYLPPSYKGGKDERYPVFYLHDGQNLFDEATSAFGSEWKADETAERLIGAGKIRPVILVGIYNTAGRMDEYSPWPDARFGGRGRGDLYARFVVEEVKPFIDKTYRTLPGREDTAVGGSSLGGLISLHLARTRRETFGLCAAISPALGFSGARILRELREKDANLHGTRFWIDMGTREGQLAGPGADATRPVEDTRALVEILKGAGLAPGKDYRYLEVEGGEHNEAAWAARFDQVLMFFFGR
jgi:predicted alpha/beta superfamily hydrolase